MMHLFAPKHLGEDVPKLYGRNSILAKIQDYIVDKEVPENIAILGVKGAGKTSLIKNAFCKAANKKYYEEAKVVVAFVSIPETTDSMKGFYSYLNMALLEGLDAVEEYDVGKYENIMTQVVEKKNKILSRSVEVDDATMEAVLNKTIEIVQSFWWYSMILNALRIPPISKKRNINSCVSLPIPEEFHFIFLPVRT